MNTKIFKFTAITLTVMLMAAAVFTTNAKKRTSKVKTVASIVQDIRNLENTPVTSRADCKTLKSKIEAVALPCFKKSMDKSAVTKVQKTITLIWSMLAISTRCQIVTSLSTLMIKCSAKPLRTLHARPSKVRLTHG